MMRPFASLPETIFSNEKYPPAPTEEECLALWDKYAMLPNVRRHSLLVAHIAGTLARRAASLGINADIPTARAAGLLHDIAKTYCLKHGGSHEMLGAAWAVYETGHYGIAQAVLAHVRWPWTVPRDRRICSLPFFVIYADKRVRHDSCVTLKERLEDLLERYGKTPASREGIRESMRQAGEIERCLERHLGCCLNEDTFDCGRLVEREGSFPERSVSH